MSRFLFFILTAFFALYISSCSNSKQENTDNEALDSIAALEQRPNELANELTETITRFVRAYNSQDSQKTNAVIHPETGLYVIYRPGAIDRYEHIDRLDFDHPIPSVRKHASFENNYALTFESAPKFSCETEKWNKEGFFCDTTAHPNRLGFLADFLNEHNESDISDEEIKQFHELEGESYQVILTTDEPLIFHVTRLGDGWYVTLLDRAYGSCDA